MREKNEYKIEITTEEEELIDGIVDYLISYSEKINWQFFVVRQGVGEEFARAMTREAKYKAMRAAKNENRD